METHCNCWWDEFGPCCRCGWDGQEETGCPGIQGKKESNKMNDVFNIAAKAAHEANRAYCIGCGDESQPTWDAAPEWQRDSAVAGVQAIASNPDTTPRQSHEGWLAHKAADGWKFGAVKNAETKEHPCFVPYDELPEAQKAKDSIFGAVVRGVLAHHGVL